MLEKLNIFRYYKLENFFEDGFTEEGSKSFYSVSPYHEDTFINAKQEDFVSYSYVLNNELEYKRYLLLENKFISAFEELYQHFKIVGLKFNKDKYHLIEYLGFLSFKEDLIKGLREDTSYTFMIDDRAIAIHCNFDLNIVVFGYHEIDHKEIWNIFKKYELHVTDLLHK